MSKFFCIFHILKGENTSIEEVFMCGFIGFTNLKRKVSSPEEIAAIHSMTKRLTHRGPDEGAVFTSDHVNFGHRRLIVLDAKHGKQPMSYTYSGVTYTVVYNGQLYNAGDIRKQLTEVGFRFDGYCDTEVILKAYIHYGPSIFKDFNGIFSFAIWNDNTNELVLCRDQFGIKPLYYAFYEDTLIFSSEIKAILAHPGFPVVIDQEGIAELFGIGPAHTPGTCAFKDIYEMKPGYWGLFNQDGLKTYQYWKMESLPHTDDFEATCAHVRYLLDSAIGQQLVSDVPLCAMLSGGLDSSIIVAYASKYLQAHHLPTLETYSIDYVDNDKNFVKSDFQPNSDSYYIELMKKEFNTNHHSIVIDTPELATTLKDAMIARDLPGMADVDSSMLLFCKHIKEGASVVLSGECSDEIFAGYPWFFREDALQSGTFPWSIAISERQTLLHPTLAKQIQLKDYINYRYQQSIDNIEFSDTDSAETKQKKVISYLTTHWFMQTLLDRSDRMSMHSGLELRVPFCDYRLVQYMWNVPWEMKAYQGREKGLLRHVVKDLLPDEIVHRKKSPYPKTHNPTYLKAVKTMLTDIMHTPNAPINDLLNRDYILDILNTDGKAFTRPWFGQLMTGPQLMAYLCQVNMWLEEYQPRIEI